MHETNNFSLTFCELFTSEQHAKGSDEGRTNAPPGKQREASERRHLILVLKVDVEFTRPKALYGEERAGIAHGRWRGKIRTRLVVC